MSADLRVLRGDKDRTGPPPPPPITPTDPRLVVFLEALPKADEEAWCSPPGIGGLWRVRHIVNGLQRGVLVVHRRGTHIAFAPFPDDHKAKGCRCRTCHWERQAEERDVGSVTPEQVHRIRAKVLALQFAQPAKPAVSALDADL